MDLETEHFLDEDQWHGKLVWWGRADIFLLFNLSIFLFQSIFLVFFIYIIFIFLFF